MHIDANGGEVRWSRRGKERQQKGGEEVRKEGNEARREKGGRVVEDQRDKKEGQVLKYTGKMHGSKGRV